MRTLKDLKTSLQEHGPEPQGAHLYPPGWSPPNILILKRKTVRSYSNTERVALYYNEKLQRYFSVPFSVGRDDSRDDVVGVSEEQLNEISIKTATCAAQARLDRASAASGPASQSKSSVTRKSYGKDVQSNFQKAQKTVGHIMRKIASNDAKYAPKTVKEEVVQEDAISHLNGVISTHSNKPLRHKDGTQTYVDPTTANALLTVHGALHPDNQKKMADAMEHSKAKFHKILDFAWKQVK